MRSITKELGDDLTDVDEVVMKIRKVDSNIFYFTKNHNGE
jgi:hypothetical protein